MDDKDMAMEIVERLLLREAENHAFRQIITSQSNVPRGHELDCRIFDLTSKIQNSQKYRKRIAELQDAFAAHTDAAALIRTLHSEILSRVEIPWD